MRERVALLDGKITIESNVGSGTTLVAEVPVP
jgi:signal transduction histidine kinase